MQAGKAAFSLVFPGFCEDIQEHMLRASAFLMTSRSEGLGRVTIEAMFCGCPVIARRSGGSLDIIEDRITGFLFDTEEQCANLISAMAMNTPQEVVEAAADRAVSGFSEESYGQRVLSIYHSVLS